MNEMMARVKQFAIDEGIISAGRNISAGDMNNIYDYIGSDHRVFAGDIVRRVDLEIIAVHIDTTKQRPS